MKRSLLVLAAVALAACKQAPSTDPVVRGERYFNGLGCVKCHQVGDAGHAWGPDLTLVGFRKPAPWLDLWLKDPHGWNDKTIMPNFNLRDDIRQDLVAYLSAQQGQAWPAKPWETEQAKALAKTERGRLIFDKAGCITCHGQNGAGGYPNNNVAGGLIPSLTMVSDGYTKDELRVLLANGRVPIPSDGSKPLPMLVMPQWKRHLGKGDIDAVVEYLFSLKPKSAGGADDF